ncbi:carbonic anhydrase family protein, partial [Acinetobacter baumannii]|uniref:carbonic anhydrase family protein n=1 Tax=Acinetobacter baumannii TaxID=470 RepID=UPI001AEC7636
MNDDGELVLRYRKKIDTFLNTGYCVQGYLKGVASINSRNFKLQQFHFHTHGEHMIDGKSFPLELHLVHQSQNEQMAVIAVLFEIGEENKTFDELLDHLNLTEFENKINLLTLVPDKLDYYYYLGSLTT